MPIVQTVNSYHEFRDAFRAYNRLDQFTNLEWLFDYIEEMYSDDNYELDVVALCCEFTESTFDEVARYYAIDLPDTADYQTPGDFVAGHYPLTGSPIFDARWVLDVDAYAEAKREAIGEYLNDHTTVVNHDDETIMFVVF